MFEDATLLITGGTGSFGNAVLERFQDLPIKEIRIFSRDEKKQFDMRRQIQDDRLKFYIGDVRDANSVDTAMRDVNYVFHAAALKQVPSCEFYPLEAVRTNIIGTENVLRSAENNGIDRVVVLSTDKAVAPANAMGMSKALMEKLMVAKARLTPGSKTVLTGTRYGNVMASRGSVIPLFIDQIKQGIPLTVTNPDMTRFLMPLSEALDLVLFAFSEGSHGDIFVQKTRSCNILDLAEVLIEIFEAKNEVKIIGTRHGEKLHETLASAQELSRSEDLGDYYRIIADDRDLNYEKYFSEGKAQLPPDDYSSDLAAALSKSELKKLLLTIPYVQRRLKN